MICELFPFQKQAVNDLRFKTALALNNFKMIRVPQVVSLQAPTGSGKTIIMSQLIEDILFGSDQFVEQQDAIFVWLSDSPQLNEQSKQKIELKADKIRFDQCEVISDESFDKEILEDGKIYFLNTQKLGKSGNLSRHSDSRQYTIWETIENTAKLKSDRLYFIIDEAHRGMQGRSAGTATTIMQRFIKGYEPYKFSPLPVIIGMSATAARFNTLVGDYTSSTLQKVIISPSQVRASGLLKDRIIITYPEDPAKHNDMAVLQAAIDEWQDKCIHWHQYTYEQHYSNVNPVFVIQVTAGTAKKVSDTDLDAVIAKIEDRIKDHFKDGEVVHTFGSAGTLTINGLNVPHVEASEIADDRKIRVVLFKENLSTGWDCPRAETMMSFRKAEDATYIAQLLGRMIRTPLQCHVQVDDSLNDVRLFLPYFNKDTVQDVINELQSAEGGEIPTVIDGESLEEQVYVTWTVHTRKPKVETQVPGQMNISDYFINNPSFPQQMVHDTPVQYGGNTITNQPVSNEGNVTSLVAQAGKTESHTDNSENNSQTPPVSTVLETVIHPQQNPEPIIQIPVSITKNPGKSQGSSQYEQLSFTPGLDRENVIKFINEQGYLTYMVRTARINSYLRSVLSLAGLLTQTAIYIGALDEVKNGVTDLIHAYVEQLRSEGKYDHLVKQVLELKLAIRIFDPFGEKIDNYYVGNLVTSTESDLDIQLRAADARMGNGGFPYTYGMRYLDIDDPDAFKVDCILFASDEECMNRLSKYAEQKFHALNDKYRKYVVSKSEKCKKQYSDIIADGDPVSKQNFALPEELQIKEDKGGKVYYDHLLAAENGAATIKLNGWEEDVLKEEQGRPDYVCWLRNPSGQSWSLCIPYEIEGVVKKTFPDFIIIRRDLELGYVIDILEPHNPGFKDNLGKAKGFAKYAEEEPRIGRIQLIRLAKDAAGHNRFKRLDMAKGVVRNKVLAAINNDELDHIFDTDGEFEDH